MKYPDKRVMYLAAEFPALSETFVYNEIFHFEERICPVEKVSVNRPNAPAAEDVLERLGDSVSYLYESPKSQRLKSLTRMSLKHPVRMVCAVFALFSDLFHVRLVSRTAAGIGYRFTYAAVLAEWMQERSVDHLHVHFAHVPGDLGMYASMMTGIPYSITGHANDIYDRGWLLKQKTQRSLFFATISEFNRKLLISKGCAPEKIEIVRCGIDQEKFEYRPVLPASSLLKIGSLGRLVKKKGFDTLIDTCKHLQTDSVDLVCEIAGDGPLSEQLSKQVESLGLQQQVKFIGALPHKQVSDWMASLDVFVLACCQGDEGDVDGIPVVLMEAMAIGVPVITTNISGLPELVVSDQTGLVFEPLDSKGLAGLLRKIEQSRELRGALSRNAKQYVEAEFTIQASIEKLAGLIFGSAGH